MAEELKALQHIYMMNKKTVHFAHLADCYLQNGDFEKALEILEKGLKLYPHHAMAHFILGKYYYQKNDFDSAKLELERAVKLFPNFENAYRLLIEIAENDDLYQLSETYKQQLKIIFPYFGDLENKVTAKSYSAIESSFETVPAELDTDEFERLKSDKYQDSSESVVDFMESKLQEELADDFDDLSLKNDEKTVNSSSVDMDNSINSAEIKTGDTEKLNKTNSQDEKMPNVSGEEQPLTTIKKPETFTKDDFDIDLTVLDSFSNTNQSEKMKNTKELERSNISANDASELIDETINHDETITILNTLEDETVENYVIETSEDLSNLKEATQTNITIEDDLSDELSLIQNSPKKNINDREKSIASPTLAELYLAQGKFLEAKEIIEILLEKDPNNERLKRKLSDVQQLI